MKENKVSHEDIRKFMTFNNMRLMFRDVVEATSGFVIEETTKVPNVLHEISKSVLENVNDRLLSENSNSKGKFVEECFGEAADALDHADCRLKGSAYPDCKMMIDGETYFVELKTTAKKDLTSTNRYFYYASSKKIKESGKHLLIGFLHEDGVITGYEIVDCYTLEVKCRSEINAGNREIYANVK